MDNSNIFYILAITLMVVAGLTMPAKSQVNPVDNICLGCICEAASGCNLTRTCTGDACGLFRYNWFYWADSGKLTINRESPESTTAFDNCAFDTECATQTVQNYMQRFKQDCNGDGKIDCYDYAIIHNVGGYNCPGRIFGNYARVLNQCLLAYQQSDTGTSEAPTTEATKLVPLSGGSIQNFDYPVEVPPLSVFELVRAKENTTIAVPRKSTELPKKPPSDDSIQNFDYAVEVPPLSVFELVRAKGNTTTPAPRKSAELPQLPPPDNSIQNFDYSVTIPPLSVFELVQAKENTTTATPLESDLSKPRGNGKSATPEIVQRHGGNAGTSAKDNIARPLSSNASTNGTDGKTIESPVALPNAILDGYLQKQDSYIEAFLNKNVIEREQNEILKQIAKNIEDSSDDTQLKIQAIENTQGLFLNILEQIKLIHQYNGYKHQRQAQFLEAREQKHRIDEERNEVLREIAKNLKKNW